MPLVEPEFRHPIQRIADRTVDLRTRVRVMAVVNRTLDSLYDDGATFAPDAAVAAARLAGSLAAAQVHVLNGARILRRHQAGPGDGACWDAVSTPTTERPTR